MPRISRWTIRMAMLYLLLGMAGWTAYTLDWTLPGNFSQVRPVSIHFLTMGWLTQLIFAVMYWMFPIITRANPYGKTWIAWLGWAELNLGLIARAIFEIAVPPGTQNWGLVGSALLQWSGVTMWIVVCWARVKERGGR